MSDMQINAQFIVDLLNSGFEADPSAMHSLIINRVPCRASLADHPEIIVDNLSTGFTVGILGILNGLLNKAGSKELVALQWDNTVENGLPKVLGFTVVENKSGTEIHITDK